MKKAFKFILGIFSFILFAGSLSLNVSNLDIKETLNIALADGDTTKEPPPPIDPVLYEPFYESCPNGGYSVVCITGNMGGCESVSCSYC